MALRATPEDENPAVDEIGAGRALLASFKNLRISTLQVIFETNSSAIHSVHGFGQLPQSGHPNPMSTSRGVWAGRAQKPKATLKWQIRSNVVYGFSKKLANDATAIALHYMHYNFCRIHKTSVQNSGRQRARHPLPSRGQAIT